MHFHSSQGITEASKHCTLNVPWDKNFALCNLPLLSQGPLARSSFTWFKIGQFILNVCLSTGFFDQILCRLWYIFYIPTVEKSSVTYLVKGSATVRIQAHIITRLHSILYRPCSSVIICAWILTVAEPLHNKQTTKFCPLCDDSTVVQRLLEGTRVRNLSQAGPPKTGPRLEHT